MCKQQQAAAAAKAAAGSRLPGKTPAIVSARKSARSGLE